MLVLQGQEKKSLGIKQTQESGEALKAVWLTKLPPPQAYSVPGLWLEFRDVKANDILVMLLTYYLQSTSDITSAK